MKMTNSLVGKIGLITGASRGLGREITKKFVTESIEKVVIISRNYQKLIEAKSEIESITHRNNTIVAIECDVTNRKQLESVFKQIENKIGRLDIVVNNAGILGAPGPSENADWNLWWKTIETNLLGTFLTCQLSIPLLKKQPRGKIINLSGGGATKGMPFFSAYAASKTAVVRLTETLAQELSPFNIDVNAVAPGALNTQMLEEVLTAGPHKVGTDYYNKTLEQLETGGNSIENAANLVAFLSSNLSEGISGRLVSAVWDDWKTLSNRADIIKNNDVYTLRRVTAKDRGLSWDY